MSYYTEVSRILLAGCGNHFYNNYRFMYKYMKFEELITFWPIIDIYNSEQNYTYCITINFKVNKNSITVIYLMFFFKYHQKTQITNND